MLLSIVVLFCDYDVCYLNQAISSIKKNVKFSDYEIIAVDNRETNKDPLILDNVKVITKGYNLNCFEGRRFGFENSSGEYIWNFDADDLMIDRLYKEDLTGAEAYQLFYKMDDGPIFDKKVHFSWFRQGAWCRIYKREILKKVYSRIDRPVNIFMREDLLLLRLVQKEVKQWDYITRVIYQYNHSLASYRLKSPKRAKESSEEDYQYVCGIIKE